MLKNVVLSSVTNKLRHTVNVESLERVLTVVVHRVKGDKQAFRYFVSLHSCITSIPTQTGIKPRISDDPVVLAFAPEWAGYKFELKVSL